MKTLIIAHRGASKIAPENTLSAFRAAKTIGADGFETDVQLTGDGKLVISHNYSIDANSNGRGYIADMTLEELKKFDFGYWKGEEFKGEKIPTLQECLEVGRDFDIVNVELKAPMNRDVSYVKLVAEVIKDSTIQDKIIVSAFDHSLLGEIKEILPDLRVGALTLPQLTITQDFLENCFPDDIPLSEVTSEDVTPPKDMSFIDKFGGIRGENNTAIILELGKALAAMFPGKTASEVGNCVKDQADIVNYVKNLNFKLDYLHCDYHDCLSDTNLIKNMKEMGIGVNVWTPDEEKDLEKLVALEPDGIITNRPDILYKIIIGQKA